VWPAAVLVAAVVTAAPAAAPDGLGAPGSTAAPRPLLGFVYGRSTVSLARFDPMTLAPLAKPRRVLARADGPASFSGDGRTVALATDRGRVRLYDTRTLNTVGELDAGAQVVASAWIDARLVVLTQATDHLAARVFDPGRRRLLARGSANGWPLAVARTGNGFAVLVRDGDGVGPTALVLVDNRARTRVVALPRVPGGFPLEEDPSARVVARRNMPGLAVDSRAGRAYVASDDLIAEVDLAGGGVSYRELDLTPTRDGNGDSVRKGAIEGPVRAAHWLGDGRLAVTGRTDRGWYDPDGTPRVESTALGAIVVDTRTWTASILDRDATELEPADGALLITSTTYTPDGQRSIGLRVYNADGTRRFEHYPGRPLWAQPYGSRAIVRLFNLSAKPGYEYDLLDLATGKILKRLHATTIAPVLLTGDAVPLR
jgi:hypothetical protein